MSESVNAPGIVAFGADRTVIVNRVVFAFKSNARGFIARCADRAVIVDRGVGYGNNAPSILTLGVDQAMVVDRIVFTGCPYTGFVRGADRSGLCDGQAGIAVDGMTAVCSCDRCINNEIIGKSRHRYSNRCEK